MDSSTTESSSHDLDPDLVFHIVMFSAVLGTIAVGEVRVVWMQLVVLLGTISLPVIWLRLFGDVFERV